MRNSINALRPDADASLKMKSLVGEAVDAE